MGRLVDLAQRLTKGSRVLVIGRLVDDTIIDLHSVERHLRMGKDPKTATIDGIAEVRLAVLASTLMLVLVAAVLAVGLDPPVRRLQRLHISRGWAVTLIFLATVAFLFIFALIATVRCRQSRCLRAIVSRTLRGRTRGRAGRSRRVRTLARCGG